MFYESFAVIVGLDILCPLMFRHRESQLDIDILFLCFILSGCDSVCVLIKNKGHKFFQHLSWLEPTELE